MPGKALNWSAVAVLISSGAAVAAGVAAAGFGVWARLKSGATANRRAAASSLRRRLNIGGSPCRGGYLTAEEYERAVHSSNVGARNYVKFAAAGQDGLTSGCWKATLKWR